MGLAVPNRAEKSQEFADLKGMMASLADMREHKASFAVALRAAKRNIPEEDQVGGATARFQSAAQMVMEAVKCAFFRSAVSKI